MGHHQGKRSPTPRVGGLRWVHGQQTGSKRLQAWQLRSGGSSSKYAPDGRSCVRWSDTQNDMPPQRPTRQLTLHRARASGVPALGTTRPSATASSTHSRSPCPNGAQQGVHQSGSTSRHGPKVQCSQPQRAELAGTFHSGTRGRWWLSGQRAQPSRAIWPFRRAERGGAWRRWSSRGEEEGWQ